MREFFLKIIKNDYFFQNLVVIIIGLWFVNYLYDSLGSILSPFFIGMVSAYILDPVVTRLTHIPFITRLWASSFIILALFFLLMLFILFAIPYIQTELTYLLKNTPYFLKRISNNIPSFIDRLNQYFPQINNAETFQSYIEKYIGTAFGWGIRTSMSLLSGGFAIANTLSMIILTPVLTFYMLLEWPSMRQVFLKYFPPKEFERLYEVSNKLQKVLRGYLKGQAFLSITLIGLYIPALWLAGLGKQSIIIGFITGFFSFIPFIGFFISFLLAITVSLSTSLTWGAIFSVVSVYCIIQLIEVNFLTPRLIGKKIELPPVWILFGVFAWGKLFGIMGVLFSLPLSATVGVMVRTFLNNTKTKKIMV